MCFGVLTWRPCLPKKVAVKSPGFNIIEEYTLDESTPTVRSHQQKNEQAKKNSTSLHVETSDESSIPRQEGPGKVFGVANLQEASMSRTTTIEDRSSLQTQSMVSRSELRSEVVNLHAKPIDRESSELRNDHSQPASQVTTLSNDAN